MGGAPTIVWIRKGVGYAPAAAASMLRLEAALGRPHISNSSYRDWDEQQKMHDDFQRWIKGQGPYPDHSYALPPDKSKHCQGLADDSPEWTSRSYIDLAADHGWIRTAAGDPTERHHFEYQEWRDNHKNDPTPGANTTESEEDDMARNAGHIFTRENTPGTKTYYLIIFNTGSGFRTMMSNTPGKAFDGGFTTTLATVYDTPSWSEVSAQYIDKELIPALDRVAFGK